MIAEMTKGTEGTKGSREQFGYFVSLLPLSERISL